MFRWLLLALFLYLLFKYAGYLLGLFGSKNSKLNNEDDGKSKMNVKYSPSEKKFNHEEGEYIDFEEVKE